MTNPRTFPIDIYAAVLHVATTRKQWRQLCDQYDNLDTDTAALGLVTLFVDTDHGANTPHLAVWVDRKAIATLPDLVDTIAHEATHAAAQLLDHVGQATERHDSEALAYLVGWVSGRIFEGVAW